METAKTIFNQINGNRLSAMVGAKNFLADKNSLKFNFKMCKKANICKITLNIQDLYDVEFFKFSNKTFKCSKTGCFENVFAEDLNRFFENFTGLKTQL